MDQVVVAGDHVWGGPRPLAVWEFMRERDWHLVRGNADEEATTESVDAAFPAGTRYHRSAVRHHAWLRSLLPAAVVQELGALPFDVRIETPAGDLLVVHSSPRSTTDQCGAPHNSVADVESAYSGTGADAIAFGHWHASFIRCTPFAVLLNVASVGLPLNRQPLAAFSILTATTRGDWIIEQHHVPYDPAEEQSAAVSAALPPWTADVAPP